MSFLVIGSMALDSVETPYGKEEEMLGGSASYVALAASFLVGSSIICSVGDDFPEIFFQQLKSNGVDLSGVIRSDKPTFRWQGYYQGKMDEAHTKDTQLGALADFAPVLTAKQQESKAVFLGNIDPSIQLAVLSQLKELLLVGLDSMNFWIDSKPEQLWDVIKKVNLLFLNDTEARALTGENILINAVAKISEQGPEIVIIKQGEYGSFIYYQQKFFSFPAYPTIDLKDPTGAGDSFAGGVMSFLLSQNPDKHENPIHNMDLLKQSIVWGTAVASFTVEGFSNSSLLGTSKEKIYHRCQTLYETINFSPIQF